MPRKPRISLGNICYHVLNRGNGRNTVFHKDGDYAAFLKLMDQANERTPMRRRSNNQNDPNKRYWAKKSCIGFNRALAKGKSALDCFSNLTTATKV